MTLLGQLIQYMFVDGDTLVPCRQPWTAEFVEITCGEPAVSGFIARW